MMGKWPKVRLDLGRGKWPVHYLWANLPRSVLTKRHWSPLALSSRNMAEYKRGRRGASAGTAPVAFLGHGIDHFLARHRLARFFQDLGSGIEGAQLVPLGPLLGRAADGDSAAVGLG